MNEIQSQLEKKPGGQQPRKHCPKTRIQSHLRRQKLIRGLIQGKAISQIAPTLDLSPKTAQKQARLMLMEPGVQQAFVRILEQSGLTDEFLSAKLRDLANARTPIYAQKDGVFTDERTVPAHETQRKTVELVCKLRGYLKESTTQDINVNIMSLVLQAMNEPPGE